MKKVLITGADGFIGKKLVRRLLDENIDIYAIIYPGNTSLDEIHNKKLHVHEVNLLDISEHIDFFPNNIDTLFHFAWAGVSPESRNDIDVQIKNIGIALNVMKLANHMGVKKVIFPGSTNEYLYYGKPINAQATPSPSNAYGSVKIACRYICADYARQHNIDFIYAIITGIYSADRKDSNVIYYTIDKLLRGEKPSLTKLEQLWDYVYIDDVIEALYKIAQHGKDRAVYAIGHGDNQPLREYIEIIRQIIDSGLPLGIGDVPYSDGILPSSCIDLADIKADTGFVPKVDFRDGITKVIDTIKREMETSNA